jgi:phosphoserine phosphatase
MTLTRSETSPGSAQSALTQPLCVDLDGTLIHTNCLHESAFAVAFEDWRILLRLPQWLFKGKGRLKRELADRRQFDPATLPYDRALLQHLRTERARGRRLVLCTASDRQIAERIAAHLALFDEVIATDGRATLRGRAKAEALCERFGREGFDYAGNDSMDLVVWDRTAVNASGAVRRAARNYYRVRAVSNSRRSNVGPCSARSIPHSHENLGFSHHE